jgi:hypothetical protein
MDARRSQFFGALFAAELPSGAGPRPGEVSVRRLCPDMAGGPRAIAEAFSSAPRGRDGAILVVGDGAEAFLRSGDSAGPGGPGGLVRGPPGWDAPSARVLGLLAAGSMAAARFDAEAVHALQPAYLRAAEAERKLARGGAS